MSVAPVGQHLQVSALEIVLVCQDCKDVKEYLKCGLNGSTQGWYLHSGAL